jgi:hypothetical protein
VFCLSEEPRGTTARQNECSRIRGALMQFGMRLRD